MGGAFDDLLTANERYASAEHEVAESGVARRGLAVASLGVTRIAIVQHTDCKMTSASGAPWWAASCTTSAPVA